MNYKIVVAAYKCPELIGDCLQSIVDQTYENIDVFIVDDDSEPGQWEIISRFVESNGWHAQAMSKRMGAMHNQVYAINKICNDPDDIIVFLDGDDKLNGSNAISILNSYYESDSEIDLSYGSYLSVPYSSTCSQAKPYPDDVVKNRSYRRFASTGGLFFNHLRTFKYKLFLQMDPDIDFKDGQGNWFMTCTDTAMMIPALELAEKHVFIEDILYLYTSNNPISDWRTSSNLIDQNHNYILNFLKPKVKNG